MNWLAREGLVFVIGFIAVLVVISIVIKLIKASARAASTRARELVAEQQARIRHEAVLMERARLSENVKTRLRRVREQNKLNAGENGNIQIPKVSLNEMIDPIVKDLEIPIISLKDIVDTMNLENLTTQPAQQRQPKRQKQNRSVEDYQDNQTAVKF